MFQGICPVEGRPAEGSISATTSVYKSVGATGLGGSELSVCDPFPRRRCVRDSFECLLARDARVYLPTDTVTTEEGGLRSPPPVTCYMGPYGEQTRVVFEMFDSHATCTLFCFVLVVSSRLHLHSRIL